MLAHSYQTPLVGAFFFVFYRSAEQRLLRNYGSTVAPRFLVIYNTKLLSTTGLRYKPLYSKVVRTQSVEAKSCA